MALAPSQIVADVKSSRAAPHALPTRYTADLSRIRIAVAVYGTQSLVDCNTDN
jgi:hypothetical protein